MDKMFALQRYVLNIYEMDLYAKAMLGFFVVLVLISACNSETANHRAKLMKMRTLGVYF